jgi:hypothetical protein
MTHRPPGSATAPGPLTRRELRRHGGVEGNARLTAATAAVLVVLLAVEGLTVLRIGPLLTVHVFVGMLLVPPVLLKMASTLWRFGRYYLGSAEYRRRGPPAPLLRALGPVVVVLTVTLFASGIALALGPTSWRPSMLLLHKASFVLWFGALAVHVLAHLGDTARLAPRDFLARTRREVRGAGLRQWALAASVVLGAVLGVVVVPHVGGWLHAGSLG